jgi:hypothetical protein
MIALQVLVALAALWAVGACTLALLNARADGAGGFATDYAAGVAILAFVGMIGIAVGAGVSLLPVYLLAVSLIAACAFTGAWTRLPRPSLSACKLPSDPIAAAALVGAVIMTGVVLSGSMQDRLWWDGWSIWAFKARVLFQEGTLPLWFMDPRGIYGTANLDYPLAVPLLDWWLFRHVAQASPAVASFAGAVWYALLPALAWSALRKSAGARIASAATLGVAAFWPISFFAAGGTADVVMAVALLGLIIEIRAVVGSGERAPLVRATVFLTLAALAKNEGLALALAYLMIVGVVLLVRRTRPLRSVLWLAVPFLALTPWFIFVRSLAITSTAVTAVGAAGTAGDRLPLFITGLRVLLSSTPWIPIPLLALLGLWAVLRTRSSGLIAGWGVIAIYAAAICSIFLTSSADMLWLLTSSAPRVFGSLIPALVYIAVVSVVDLEETLARPDCEELADAIAV